MIKTTVMNAATNTPRSDMANLLSQLEISECENRVPTRASVQADACKLSINENGEPIRFPVSSIHELFTVSTSAVRRNGSHRKSGVLIRPAYACPVESYLLPSACLPSTPSRTELQALG